MAKQNIGIGSTGRSEYIYIIDSLSSTGLGKTGILFNTSGLNGHYVRNAGSATTITFASQTATGDWISGGWAEVDQIRMPGIYRVDLPDAIFASGSDKSIVFIKGVSNTIPVTLEYQLTASNPNTFTEASIASSTWTNSSRTITGGIADTVTTLITRSGFAITNVSEIQSGLSTVTINQIGASIGQSISDVGLTTIVTGRIDATISSRLASASYITPPTEASIASTVWSNATRTITGGTITSVSNPVDITTSSMSGIANTVWTNVTRTLSSGSGISAYDIWNFANRTLTSSSGATAYEIWNFNNRTLSSGSGISAYDVWNYTDRIITGGTGISINQAFPENFEFMLITNTGRIYLNKADIEKIRA
jgi:hypothetical protein